MIFRRLIPFIALLPNINLIADEQDYFGLSFQELSEIQIITASQELESTAESTSIVSVITKKQLKQWI